MTAIVTENAFLILAALAYLLFFYGLFHRSATDAQMQQKTVVLVLSMLFLFVTAALSTPANNQVIGLLNVGLGFLAAALALITSAELL